MQNVLLPGAAVLLAVFFWLRRKPVKPMLSSTDASVVAQLNRSQLELIIEKDEGVERPSDLTDHWTAPRTAQERIAQHRELSCAMEAGPDERLQAVRLAALWGHQCILPILRRALRDSDSRVVGAAASAIERYRGAPSLEKTQTARPPRNVSRMR